MRKFVVLSIFQVFATTGCLTLFAIATPPSLSQESDAETVVETLIEDVSEAEEAAEPAYTAVSTKNPEISTLQLQLLLTPLTADQLTVEADAWLSELGQRVQSISELELAIQQENDILDVRRELLAELEQARQSSASQFEVDTIQQKLTALEIQAATAQADPRFKEIFATALVNYEIVTGADLVERARKQLSSIEAGEERDKATSLILRLEGALQSYESAEAKLDEPFFSDSRYEKAFQTAEERKADVAKAYRNLENSPLFTPKLVDENAPEKIRDQLIAQSTILETSRSGLITRMQVVLDELEKKGGDIEAYDRYTKAVSGLDFDVTDAQGIRIRFLTWLQSEDGGIKLGLGLLKFGGIMAATFIIAPQAGKLSNKVLSKVDNISTLFRGFIVNTVKRAVLVVGGLLALASMGVNLGPILALVGGFSFVLAFALQSNLGNFASGLMLLLYKPFDVDDEVEVAGEWAVIQEITLANTVMKAWNNGRVISIPNSTVWGSTIINRTPKDGVRKFCEKVLVNVNQDLVKAKRVIEEAIAAHPLVIKDSWHGTFAYDVGQYAQIFCIARATSDDYWQVHEDLVLQIHSRLSQEGILFSVPEHHISLTPTNNDGAYEKFKQTKDMKRLQSDMGIEFEPG